MKHFFPKIKDKPIYDWGIAFGPLLIPVIIAICGYLYSNVQDSRDEARKNHEVMTSYLDSMTELILVRHLGKPKLEVEGARTVARAITLNAARRLNGDGRGQLLKFLYEAELIGVCKPEASPKDRNLSKSKTLPSLSDKGKCDDPVFALEAAKLDGAVLGSTSKLSLKGVKLDKANLRGANLPNISLPFASISEANLTSIYLSEADLTGVEAKEAADLTNAYLEKSTLTSAVLPGAVMSSALLKCAKLDKAELRGANLNNAELNNADLSYAILGKNMQGNELTDLTKADLRGAILAGVDLSNVILSGAKLEGAFYDWRTTPPKNWSFEALKMQPEAVPQASLKERQKAHASKLTERKEVCKKAPLTEWTQPNQEPESKMVFDRFPFIFSSLLELNGS